MDKGTITIKDLNSKENPYAVDFDGKNEGSGSPCKDEKEVDECVKSLLKQHSSKYKIEVIDKRKGKEVKQAVLGETIKHNDIIEIPIKYGLDSEGKRDWTTTPPNDMIVYHSSGGYGDKDITIEEKLEILKKDLIEDYEKEGFKKENIKFKEIEMTNEDKDEWKKSKIESIERDIKYEDRQIAKLKEDLTKTLKKRVMLNLELKKMKGGIDNDELESNSNSIHNPISA